MAEGNLDQWINFQIWDSLKTNNLFNECVLVPNVVLLLEQINISPHTWYVVIDLLLASELWEETW